MGVATVVGHDGPMIDLDEGGGAPAVALLTSASGDDSPPLPGDSVVVISSGAGRVIIACVDNKNDGTAQPGEVRRYSRSAAGTVMAVLHMRADGSVAIEAPGGLTVTGDVTIGGKATIAGDLAVGGDLDATGEITATEVNVGEIPLSLHVHTSAAPGSPTSGPAAPPAP